MITAMKKTIWNYVSGRGTTLDEVVMEGFPEEMTIELRPQ